MTIPTQPGGDFTADDLTLWRREARAYEDGYKRGIADQLGPTRRKLAEAGAAGALLVWALGRRRHPLGTLFILGGLAALVAAVAIFWALVAIALVIGAVAFVACEGRRVPGAAWPVLLAAAIVFAVIFPVSLCLTLPAGTAAALASRKTRVAQPLELAPPRRV
jgi:fatty acid desaturase